MSDRHRLPRAALVLCTAWVLAACGCATVPRDPAGLAAYKATNDPLEPLNRKMFAFNLKVDRYVLKPAAKAYVHAIPSRARDGIRNFMKNLDEPLVAVNNLLQLEFKRAGTTVGRFLLNSTVGALGIMDFAGRHGLPRQIGDFGQTLYVWHIGDGPYLVIPVFGPTTPRDGIGQGIDIFVDPLFYVARYDQYRSAVAFTRLMVPGIDERARNLDTLDELERESVDFYAAMRSLYRQNRAAQLHHGSAPAPTNVEDLYGDPGQ